MKILQINGYESPGQRFHGLGISPLLQEKGVKSKHFVWKKDTDNGDVLTLKNKWTRHYNNFITAVEFFTANQSVFYNNAKKIIELPEFQEADLIHLHIIHSGFFSFKDLSLLTSLKPTVWTLHDPWALTGHCIYPYDCERWKIGCGECPYLNTPKKLLFDRTKSLFKYKQKSYKKSEFELIVASKFMQDMLDVSPMFDKDVKVNHLPFGVDLDFFNPDALPHVREVLKIPQDAFVICFRSDYNEFKGLSYILEALDKLHCDKGEVWLVTLSGKPLKGLLGHKYNVIDLGWVNETLLLRNALLASDIFLMPSIAEAFGMMAIEAMACAKPVVVFDGTSLPDVVGAPDVGISIPKDADLLRQTIENLKNNRDERTKRGKLSRSFAEKNYDVNDHVQNLLNIYKRVAKK